MAKSKDHKAGNSENSAAESAPRNKSGGSGKRRAGKDKGSGRNNLLVRDFLVPRLDSSFYGEDLVWQDRTRGIFLISWTHQSSKSFDREGPNFFRDWSIMKGKWHPQDPKGLSKAKQRVRAAFRKLPNVCRINQKYPKPDEEESKENERPPCDPDCALEDHQSVSSPASVADDEGGDTDEVSDSDEESHSGSSET
ncbi:hypothetical protein HPB52_017115 [Rhipicephalus sanguineus]|uniref:IRF tryptophan pentad repeat domain-containing protein n=1 Tax=Rhipicephalus sanguineus TaxID=34632 RepID=A0A9D4QH33_RHISA|nr:hypothetical protein HPB52_017115 [Rhipicephalus sanguineus]